MNFFRCYLVTNPMSSSKYIHKIHLHLSPHKCHRFSCNTPLSCNTPMSCHHIGIYTFLDYGVHASKYYQKELQHVYWIIYAAITQKRQIYSRNSDVHIPSILSKLYNTCTMSIICTILDYQNSADISQSPSVRQNDVNFFQRYRPGIQ